MTLPLHYGVIGSLFHQPVQPAMAKLLDEEMVLVGLVRGTGKLYRCMSLAFGEGGDEHVTGYPLKFYLGT